MRLGRHGRPVVLTRFRELPGGAFGRALERIGARELPLLFAVLRGRLSFVGPRALPPGTGSGHTGPRRLMAPGLTGPGAARRATAAADAALDDAYVESWTLWGDARLLVGRCPKLSPERVEDQLVGHGLERQQRGDQRCGRLTSGAAARHHERHEEEPDALGLGLREAERSQAIASTAKIASASGCAPRLQREPRDRDAEDQQERGGGAEQPVRVRAPRRDPDLVDAARSPAACRSGRSRSRARTARGRRAATAPMISAEPDRGLEAVAGEDEDRRPGARPPAATRRTARRRRARARRATGRLESSGIAASRPSVRKTASARGRAEVQHRGARARRARRRSRAASLVEHALGRARRSAARSSAPTTMHERGQPRRACRAAGSA